MNTQRTATDEIVYTLTTVYFASTCRDCFGVIPEGTKAFEAYIGGYHGHIGRNTLRCVDCNKAATAHECDDELACSDGCTCFTCSTVLTTDCKSCPSVHCKAIARGATLVNG